MMFKVIETLKDLPEGPLFIARNIFADTKLEAHAYSNRWPDRQIYWVEEEQMGVWISRRKEDLKEKT